MKIQRINTYEDARFSDICLQQHGCFVSGNDTFEIEIISLFEAVIRGTNSLRFEEVIEEYRFYTEHITTFYDEKQNIIKQYDRVKLFTIPIKEIQPSQFYVDASKLEAVSSFIHEYKDIVIPVVKYEKGYISLDGHTRLLCAIQKGYTKVQAYISECDECIFDFVEEARNRKIVSPYDLQLLNHEEYEMKWNMYCDDYFNKIQKQN